MNKLQHSIQKSTQSLKRNILIRKKIFSRKKANSGTGDLAQAVEFL
jgi:hypothetical protein